MCIRDRSSSAKKIVLINFNFIIIRIEVDFIYQTFELLMHARRLLWSPSSKQELSSFHLVDPNLVCCDEYDIWVL